MRERYARLVELSNQGAREMGFKDLRRYVARGYDMTPDEFSADMEWLWKQVQPLYFSLHAFVRAKLVEKYGPNVVPPDGPHSRSPARQSLGTGVGQHLSLWSRRRTTSSLSTSPICSRRRSSTPRAW